MANNNTDDNEDDSGGGDGGGALSASEGGDSKKMRGCCIRTVSLMQIMGDTHLRVHSFFTHNYLLCISLLSMRIVVSHADVVCGLGMAAKIL